MVLLALPLLGVGLFWLLAVAVPFEAYEWSGIARTLVSPYPFPLGVPLLGAFLVVRSRVRGALRKVGLCALTLALTVVFAYGSFIAVLFAGDEGSTGCPNGRVYC